MGNEKGMSRYSYSRSGVGMYPILATKGEASLPPLNPPSTPMMDASLNHVMETPASHAGGGGRGGAAQRAPQKHKNDPAWRLRQLIPKCKQIRVGGAHPRMNAVDLRALLKRLKLAIVDKET